MRGTHNSYHVDSYNKSFAPWSHTHRPIYEQLDRLAIRQLELDVNFDSEAGIEVYHVAGVDEGSRCRRFTDCLADIRRFSDAYPGTCRSCPDRAQERPSDRPDRAVL